MSCKVGSGGGVQLIIEYENKEYTIGFLDVMERGPIT